MKACLVRSVGLGVLLALIPFGIHAQNGRRGDPLSGYTCVGGGIRCLFGSAAGCTVTCPNGFPNCEGARCLLGFPIASSCYCDSVNPG